MGQQQLLLIVLTSIIVGLAVVTGIQAFEESNAKSNQDALIQDALAIISNAKALEAKPPQFGGVDNFSEVTLDKLPLDTSPSSYEGLGDPVTKTPHGECEISDQTATTLEITCESNQATVTVEFDFSATPQIQTRSVSLK